MREYRVTQSSYVLKDELPDGRAVWIDEEPGRADVWIRRGMATQAFCTHMTKQHAYILGGGGPSWVQVWTDGEVRADGPIPEVPVARAWWEIDDANNHVGELAIPLEKDGAFVWYIREGHVKPATVEQMNRYLASMVGRGLWVQRDWDDEAGTATPSEGPKLVTADHSAQG